MAVVQLIDAKTDDDITATAVSTTLEQAQAALAKAQAAIAASPLAKVIQFNLQGGIPIATQILTPADVTEMPDPAPTHEDYTFMGWYKEVDYTTAWDFDNDKVTQNMTLYAKWIPNALSKLEVTYAGGKICEFLPPFSPTSYEYTCNVPPEVTAVWIYARSPIYDADTKNTSLTGTGNKDLKKDSNSTTYTVIVDSRTYGEFKYTITVKKPPTRKRRRRCPCKPTMEICDTGPNV